MFNLPNSLVSIIRSSHEHHLFNPTSCSIPCDRVHKKDAHPNAKTPAAAPAYSSGGPPTPAQEQLQPNPANPFTNLLDPSAKQTSPSPELAWLLQKYPPLRHRLNILYLESKTDKGPRAAKRQRGKRRQPNEMGDAWVLRSIQKAGAREEEIERAAPSHKRDMLRRDAREGMDGLREFMELVRMRCTT